MTPPFDPTFDDCQWTDAWMRAPIIQVTPGVYDRFVVKSWQVEEAAICDQRVKLTAPLDVRGLITADGTLWMSDVPQERLMMFNNAQKSQGKILVGGLGLGMYPQYAMQRAESITVIEANPAIKRIVEPVARITADAHRVPFEVRICEIEAALSGLPAVYYDTIFLDTWETLDAAHLPVVNHLRNLAIKHLATDGRVLLWGYAWMLRLFTDACRKLLEVTPSERLHWLEALTSHRTSVQAMLMPVVEQFDRQVIDDWDAALAWCREYAIRYTGEG